ncbi:MAG: hypothetical protein ABR553_01820 [Gammaproteobacteria bacterium]
MLLHPLSRLRPAGWRYAMKLQTFSLMDGFWLLAILLALLLTGVVL